MASPISVPRRSDLLDQMSRANRFAWVLLFFEIVVLAMVAAFIDWKWVEKEPVLTTVAICFAVGSFATSILRSIITKKVRIQDLKETTKFGQFDKYRLEFLYRDTLAKLGLPDDGLSVYVIGGRSVNAMAMHWGLGRLFKSLNGIYLNRQSLHKLEPVEIQDLMGHELGHYYKHYLVIDRFRIVTLALGVLIGLLAVQQVGLGMYGYFILATIQSLFWWLSALPHSLNSQAIEYLCDDYGAQVGGVIASIHGLLKLGMDAEVQCAVMQQAILSKVAGNLNPSELIDAIEASIPYGHASRAEIEDKVNRELRARVAGQTMSLTGFLHYIWNSESEENAAVEMAKEAKKIRKLQSEPRLNWEALLPHSDRVEFDFNSLRDLVALIESRPEEHLFRIPENPGDSHPPLRLRILYLWNNRSEIPTPSGR